MTYFAGALVSRLELPQLLAGWIFKTRRAELTPDFDLLSLSGGGQELHAIGRERNSIEIARLIQILLRWLLTLKFLPAIAIGDERRLL